MDLVSSKTKSGERSIITCPQCGFQKEEEMPVDSCLFFYECVACKARLRPLPGDCCVFCSFGTTKCPSQQARKRS
jgi:hypothetical protein